MKIPRQSWFYRMIISLSFYYEYPFGKDLKNFGNIFPACQENVLVNGIVVEDGKEFMQIPYLIPQVKDNLMPHMVGDVVTLVTRSMTDFLRGKTK